MGIAPIAYCLGIIALTAGMALRSDYTNLLPVTVMGSSRDADLSVEGTVRGSLRIALLYVSNRWPTEPVGL